MNGRSFARGSAEFREKRWYRVLLGGRTSRSVARMTGQKASQPLMTSTRLPMRARLCDTSLRLGGGAILVAWKELAEVAPYQKVTGRPW